MNKKLSIFYFITFLATGCMTMDMKEVQKVQDDHDNRIRFLEEWVGGLNEEISNLQQIIRAEEGKDFITSVQTTGEGIVIHFMYAAPITIHHGIKGDQGADGQPGQDGTDGKDGTDGLDGKPGTDAPFIGVKKENGQYYWTITTNGSTSFLKDDKGEKLAVTGIKGETGDAGLPGINGQPGVTPVLSISPEGNWLVNGQEILVDGHPLPATGPEGEKGPDGLPGNGGNGAESSTYFRSVDLQTDHVTFTLKDGSTFTLPVCGEIAFELTDTGISYRISENETRTLPYTGKEIHNLAVTAPAGWQTAVDVQKQQIYLTAPARGNLHAATEGTLSIIVSNGKGQQLIVNRSVCLILTSYLIDLSGCSSSRTDVYVARTPGNRPVAEICYEYVKGYTETVRQRSWVVYPWNPATEDYSTGYVVANGGRINHDGTGYQAGNKTLISSICIDERGQIVPNEEARTHITPRPEVIKDFDLNEYGIVKIGDQYWMRENYRCTRYKLADGTLKDLNRLTDYEAYEAGSETVYSWLYDYAKIFQDKEKGSVFLPEGWHLPKSKEITELMNFIPRARDLRAISPAWKTAVGNESTNLSGFGALPGGYINTNLSSRPHYDLHMNGEYWSSTELSGVRNPVLRVNYNTDSYTIKEAYNYAEQRSIRCIRDSWKK